MLNDRQDPIALRKPARSPEQSQIFPPHHGSVPPPAITRLLPRSLRHPRRTAVRCVLLLTSLAVIASACSSSASTSKSSSTTSGSGSLAAYRSCLESHGVTPPSGPSGSGGFPGAGAGGSRPGGTGGGGLSSNSAFAKAAAACASLRPKSATTGGRSTAFAAYINCMKLHGVTLSGGLAPGASTSTTSSPKVKAATAACASLRPKGGVGGGSSGSTTTTTS